MNQAAPSLRSYLLAVLGAGLAASCSSPAGPSPDFASVDGSSSGSGGSQASGSSGSGGPLGGDGSGGGNTSSSGTGSASGGPILGGMEGGPASPPEAGGGSSNGAGSGGPVDSGTGGSSGGADASAPNNCNLPATVSFLKDVLPFLGAKCGGGGDAGNAGTGGCHVIDGANTMAAGGKNHAYDWITGLSHSSSCPELPTPFRFQVTIAVVDGANPPTCSRSRKMPPQDVTGSNLRAPLTTCEVATLQAWLDEPLVTQTHRPDGISPTTPYPMPPFN